MKCEEAKVQYETLLAISGTLSNEKRYIHGKLILILLIILLVELFHECK